MRRSPLAVFLMLLLFAASTSGALGAEGGIRPLPSPCGAGCILPNLSVGEDGRVYLSWVEAKPPNQHVLRFCVLDGDRWSEPRDVITGANWFVNWADFPSVAPIGRGALAAHWLVRNGDETFAYQVHTARSENGGRDWSRAVVPHRDMSATEHGFVSLLAWKQGAFAAAWLDGRQFAKSAGQTEPLNEMTLRFAVVDADGQLQHESQLDDRVCECCQTAAARTSKGIVIVYRDRSEEEVRDIGIVRHDGKRWSRPEIVHQDGWKIEGCPVNGPSIAARDARVAVAWYTAANGVARVRVAFSPDAAVSFGKPIDVDDGKPLGRVDVELLPDGSALVLWIEQTAHGAEVRARRIDARGRRGPTLAVAATSSSRASGFPRMARSGDRIVFAWTQASTPPIIHTAICLVSAFR